MFDRISGTLDKLPILLDNSSVEQYYFRLTNIIARKLLLQFEKTKNLQVTTKYTGVSTQRDSFPNN